MHPTWNVRFAVEPPPLELPELPLELLPLEPPLLLELELLELPPPLEPLPV